MSPATPRRRQCGTMEVHHRLLEMHPTFRQSSQRIEQFIARSMLSGEAQRVTRQLITIPVVVHVVYRRAVENITAAQIRSQIAVLNRDYRATNPDKSIVPSAWRGLVADANLQFALATRDPSGASTTGITRTQTSRTSFAADDSVKTRIGGGHPPWPSSRYLNIWACNLGGGLLGYAQFPGGPARTDGVVILYSALGNSGTVTSPFNLGRTATHEIGHWLNLHHIWGDRDDCGGTDFVVDTPNAQFPNYGKPAFPHISCNNGPNGDMFVNYMDYVDDAAMVMFTPGQVTRMNATLAGPRQGIAAAGARLRRARTRR